VTERFDLLALDLDGVLADTTRCHAAAWARLFAEMGRPAPAYDLIAGRRTADVIAAYGAEAPERVAGWTARKQALARSELAREGVLFADTTRALRALAGLGLRLAIGTGASRATATAVIGRLDLDVAFETIVTAEDVSRGKPHPDVYLLVLERTGVPAERALVAEDSGAGVEAALAAGTHVVSVRSGLRVPDARFLGAFEDLNGLAAWLGGRP
jgi:beta-phosphoglucomutase